MAQLRLDYDRIRSAGAELIAICPERRPDVKRYWDAERMPFPGLSDWRHRVADQYGQRWSLLKLGRLPSLVVVDRDGVIRQVYHARDMTDIPTTDTLLAWLHDLPAASQPG